MSAEPSGHSLTELLQGVPYQVLAEGDAAGWQPTTVTADSRQNCAGALFIALTGSGSDGHAFIAAAVAAGCRAVLCRQGRLSREEAGRLGVTVLATEETAVAYSRIAANFFARPAEHLRLVAITGTNGKTTVSYLLEEVLRQCGQRVGVIGTVEVRYPDRNGRQCRFPARLTTPEPFELHRTLREMVEEGVEYLVMEVSSHALTQSRVAGLRFTAAAFTNISRDHLDYHQGMEEYFQAKASLFSNCLDGDGVAVLPALPGRGETAACLPALYQLCRQKALPIVSWGEGKDADIALVGVNAGLGGTDIDLRTAGGSYSLHSPLLGRFNIDNILCTLALGSALGLAEKQVVAALGRAGGAPGRLERVTTPGEEGEPVVLVDYAHTPDALEKVLQTLAALPHRRLFTIFGCGGDRDRGKRPLMGEIAARLSDVAVVTDDNPRNEDPGAIVAEIVSGCRQGGMVAREADWLISAGAGGRGYLILRDRQQAIELAIRAAGAGDLVLIAGKGHETYQLTRAGKRAFDDRRVAADVLLNWTVNRVVTATAGRLLSGGDQPRLLGQIFTDSRRPCPNGIFVALRGDNHDGHRYVEQAVAGGARCLVVERPLPLATDLAVDQVVVGDSLRALGDLAAFRRRLLAEVSRPLVLAITGSCGKTTVKEMTAAILARRWPAGPDHPEETVLRTRGNFNNLIGLPLSLLPLAVHHRAAVLEMGMNRAGELLRLGEIARPAVSCITNIHPAHLEELVDIDGVARAKEELFAATDPDGTLVVNLDDQKVATMATRYPQRRICYALAGEANGVQADLWASDLQVSTEGGITFTLHRQESQAPVRLHTVGEHNVSNALAAAAIATAAGAELAEIVAGLADFRAGDKRLSLEPGRDGLMLLNDCYNANPASMASALKTLRQLAGSRQAVAIIGDMLELGETSASAHAGIGRLIARLGLDQVGVVGRYRQEVVAGAVAAGFPTARIRALADKEAAGEWLESMLAEKTLVVGDLVLVKASRGLHFETIVARLQPLEKRAAASQHSNPV